MVLIYVVLIYDMLTYSLLLWTALTLTELICSRLICPKRGSGNLKGAGRALHLETVLLGDGEPRYFDTCERRFTERWLDWEHLRTVGRLPLFGASYTVLILIPIIFYGLAIYNNKVDLVRTWAEQIASIPHHPMKEIATVVIDRFHRQPIPSLSFSLLISTLLLAAASTLYTFFCPPIVKDFSYGQWVYQLNRPLLHYWALTWKWRWIRLICAACYLFGGLGALGVLATKVLNAAWFILANSDFSW